MLEELLGDAHGDDEQLTALSEGIGEALDLPLDVHVVGEPLSLLAVNYDGNARRGFIGRCRREDTKTRDKKLEEAYSRHFVWPGKGSFRPPRSHSTTQEPASPSTDNQRRDS